MSCNNEECKCKEYKVKPATTKDGVWLENAGEDIHVYNLHNVQKTNGSVIGYNNKLLRTNKLKGTPLALSMTDGKCYLQVVSNDNEVKTYNVNPDKLYDLMMRFLHDVKNYCVDETPPATVQL